MEIRTMLEEAIKASIDGGKEILEVYQSTINVVYKEDNSPLTEADKRSHLAIEKVLSQYSIPVLSEEGKHQNFSERKEWESLWIVDPLDGTKEFIKRNGEFTVNIALVEKDELTIGVIYVPVGDVLYFAAKGVGAYRLKDAQEILASGSLREWIQKSKNLPEKQDRAFTMVGSRSHMSNETAEYFEAIQKKHPNAQVISKGSSLKICMVAEGSADVYPRFAPTMEWDTAAGHAIANQAGFELVRPDDEKPLEYNKENLLNPWFIVRAKVVLS